MEHDVVPLTGCYARGGSIERSAGGTAQRAAALVRVRSQYTFGTLQLKLLSFSTHTNGSVHILPEGTLCATSVLHCRAANRYVIKRGLKM